MLMTPFTALRMASQMLFQIPVVTSRTPFQASVTMFFTAVSAVVNGGTLVTPHFAIRTEDSVTGEITELAYETKTGRVTEQTSGTMRSLLEAVVSEGTGKNAQVEGYQVGGKTATSEKLPRRSGKYISSFLGFAPANDPKVIALIMIDEPVGTYYGGTIAAPVVKEIFENILPYLGIKQEYIASEESSTSE